MTGPHERVESYREPDAPPPTVVVRSSTRSSATMPAECCLVRGLDTGGRELPGGRVRAR